MSQFSKTQVFVIYSYDLYDLAHAAGQIAGFKAVIVICKKTYARSKLDFTMFCMLGVISCCIMFPFLCRRCLISGIITTFVCNLFARWTVVWSLKGEMFCQRTNTLLEQAAGYNFALGQRRNLAVTQF